MPDYTCSACGYRWSEHGCTAEWCGFFRDTLDHLLDY